MVGDDFMLKYILIVILFPIVLALVSNSQMGLNLILITFSTFIVSKGIFAPLSELFFYSKRKIIFWTLFTVRMIILSTLCLSAKKPDIIIFYEFSLISALIGVISIISAIKINKETAKLIDEDELENELFCSKCDMPLKETDRFCSNCGAAIINKETVSNQDKIWIKPFNFDPIYSKSEDTLIEEFIKKELIKVSLDDCDTLITEEMLKRKKILSITFSIMLFTYISLIFFHFPLLIYIIGGIILTIFFLLNRKYTIIKYLKKEIKSRPKEKISNIIMNTKTSLVKDNSSTLKIISILLSVILPILIFMNPKIIYEPYHDSYFVRFYTFGITNFKTATIPKEYNGKKVVGLRGNTFSNMPFLKKVNLADSITEIRGQAFKNDISLVEITLPSNLKYLGGGSFYNCTSLKKIILPDTLTYMGGETFYNASSLQRVKLSNNLTEIRGNTFENCISLVSITIPDKVTRIGGHAFYGNNALREVEITQNSQLKEIGSSAFRRCYSLYNISIPDGTNINERSFKESPTKISYFSTTSYQ